MTDLQFETAEYAAGAPTCSLCGQPVTGEWWTIGGNPYCAPCRHRVAAFVERRASAGELARGLLFGLGAALAGSAAWYGVREGTGYELGLLAIGVAWLVSAAVVAGAGRGGPQQLAAVALTYLSIAWSYAPYAYDAALGVAGVAIAAVTVLAMPVFLAQEGDAIWFVIVGIALWSAFQRTRRPNLTYSGPFTVASPP